MPFVDREPSTIVFIFNNLIVTSARQWNGFPVSDARIAGGCCYSPSVVILPALSFYSVITYFMDFGCVLAFARND